MRLQLIEHPMALFATSMPTVSSEKSGRQRDLKIP